ncbi:AsnC family transcriptional regulator [Peptococcaceae bacterium]|nr:AsnC family transcriptional regulator [Peptococcaceae bacterium]
MLTEKEKTLIRELQTGLPLCTRPFAELGEKVGMSEDEVLAKVNEFIEKGYMRRIGAALRHRKVGYDANAMIVWNIPEDRIDEIGNKLVRLKDVTHVYKRKPHEKWPYNFYAMIHRKTREECYERAKELADMISEYDYQLIFSIKELKKSSMHYFTENLYNKELDFKSRIKDNAIALKKSDKF